MIDAAPDGTAVFEDISSQRAAEMLRTMLSYIGVEGADRYRPHDLRRGHAEDLRVAGRARIGTRAL